MELIPKTFVSDDGHTIYTYKVLPESSFEKIIVIIHGYGEHFARYEHVIEALVNAGFAVYGIDHRGHGRSTGERAYFTDFEAPVADIHVLMENIEEEYPNKDIFIFGHSMGSMLAVAYALKNQQALNGLILTGTGISGGDNVSTVLRTVGTVIARFRPHFPILPNGGLDILTRDKEMVKKAEEDEFMYKGAWKAGMGKLLLDVGDTLKGDVHKLMLPMLIMHGTADELTPPAGSQWIYDHAQSTDKTIKFWDGMHHEIHNEIGREDVILTIIDWVNQH